MWRRRYRVLQWQLKRQLARYEARVADLLYGRVRAAGKLAILAFFLRGLSWLFGGVVRARWALYERRVFKQEYLGCLVVVIGNLTVGGTGKTPIVEKFARELIAKGRKVAILSRGYKRRESKLWRRILGLFDPEVSAPTVVSDGQKIRCDWRRAGDEPYMLAQNIPGAIVIVDKNRVKAGIYAIRKYGADTLLLDDGFQYYPLKSRLQLVLIDQQNPFGNGDLLPRGILREPISALRRASYVFITKSDGHPPEHLLRQIAEVAPGRTPIVCTHSPVAIYPLGSAEPLQALPLSRLQGARVVAFSGIAVPESFERLLRRQGATLIKTFRFADHYGYEPEDIDQILKTAVGMQADFVITTEKDAVRVPSANVSFPVHYLRMEVELLSGAQNFAAAVDEICLKDSKA
jgi:tetraacyldisaccharide 4'-kinase